MAIRSLFRSLPFPLPKREKFLERDDGRRKKRVFIDFAPAMT